MKLVRIGDELLPASRSVKKRAMGRGITTMVWSA